MVAWAFLAFVSTCYPVAAADTGSEPETRPEAVGKRSSGEYPNHIIVGIGIVSDTGEETGDAFRTAVSYERTLPASWGGAKRRWGLGVILENNAPPVRAVLTAVQICYHPVPQFRMVVAPGYQFYADAPNSALLRFGMSWEFEIGKRMSLAPELYYDFLEARERSAVIGVSFGYGW